MKIDEKDHKILKILEKDSKLTIRQIAKVLNTPITTVHNRIKKLEEKNIIQDYTIRINHDKLGKSVVAFIFITVNNPPGKKISQQAICKKILPKDEVENISIITGNQDIIVKVRVSSIANLNKFITGYLRNIEGIDKTETMIALEEF